MAQITSRDGRVVRHVEGRFTSFTPNGYEHEYRLGGVVAIKTGLASFFDPAGSPRGRSAVLADFNHNVFEPTLQTRFCAWGWTFNLSQGKHEPMLMLYERVGDQLLFYPAMDSFYEEVRSKPFHGAADIRLVLITPQYAPSRIGHNANFTPPCDWTWVREAHPELLKEEKDVVSAVNGCRAPDGYLDRAPRLALARPSFIAPRHAPSTTIHRVTASISRLTVEEEIERDCRPLLEKHDFDALMRLAKLDMNQAKPTKSNTPAAASKSYKKRRRIVREEIKITREIKEQR